jgi:hypothetical protein
MVATRPSPAVPRTYRFESRVWMILYSIMALGIWAIYGWLVASGAKKLNFSSVLFPSLYLLMAGVFVARFSWNFVRLSKDAIEVRRLWRRKILPFDAIKGRRRYAKKSAQYPTPIRHLALEPGDDRFPRIDLVETDRFDEDFYRWFDALPDLDALDQTKPNPERHQDQCHGSITI